MKLRILFSLLIFTSFIAISCSSDDGDSQNPPAEKNYFPLVQGNSWDYINTISAENQQDMVSQETLSVSNTGQVGGNTTYEFESSNTMNSAIITLALTNGLLYKNGSSLFYTGSFGFGTPEFSNFIIEIEDGKLYDKNASEGTEFFSIPYSIQEIVEGLEINIDYTLTSVMGSSIDRVVVNNETYNDVITSQLIITMEINANLGIPVTILDSQEVVVITNYFAKDVGLVKSENDTNFNFISFPTLPLEDISVFTMQELEGYSLNVE